MPLARRSLDLWGRLQVLLGQDVEFRATGHLRLVFDAAGAADMATYAAAAEVSVVCWCVLAPQVWSRIQHE